MVCDYVLHHKQICPGSVHDSRMFRHVCTLFEHIEKI